MIRVRYRIRFAKTGLLRWISHHDMLRLWERLLRRVSLPLSMSEGFHPKPRLNFPSALALGIPGLDEVVECDLCEDLPAEEVYRRLVADEQPGLVIHSVDRMAEGAPKAQLARSVYLLQVPPTDREWVARAVAEFDSKCKVTIDRDGKSLEFDLAKEVSAVELTPEGLVISLNASRQTSMRPAEVASVLGCARLLEQGEPLTRLRVELEDNKPLSLQEQP